MPTPFEPQPIPDWSARTEHARRSLFANYAVLPEVPVVASEPPGGQSAARSAAVRAAEIASVQSQIDAAMARSFIYRLLAKAYEDPDEQGWGILTSEVCQQGLIRAVATLATTAPALVSAAALMQRHLVPEAFEGFLATYLSVFGHAARGRCPLNEIEYGDIKADPLFQPHRLADLAAFYRAFGLELTDDADERHDHICLELEFMCVLTAKEAYALEQLLDAKDLANGQIAQKKFLREHLGRWTPAFARRLARMAGDNALGALATLTGAFVLSECARFGLAPGSEDLLLRPVDEAAESLCTSCAMTALPPGAAPTST